MQSNEGLRHVGVWLAAAGMPAEAGAMPALVWQASQPAQAGMPGVVDTGPSPPAAAPLFTRATPCLTVDLLMIEEAR